MSEEIKAGDVVQLKSGGPVMTVASVGDYMGEPSAWCEWFDGKKPYKETFALVTVTKYSPRPIGSRAAF
jgi:uncharacterized protein YodC (DUF2158 family)